MTAPLRTVVWSTGGVGSIAIDAIRRRPDLELVGVWVHSDEKVGKDAGELAGGEPSGWRPPTMPMRSSRWRPTAWCTPPAGPNATRPRCPTICGCWRRVSMSCRRRRPVWSTRPRTTRPTGATSSTAAARSGNASFYASGIFPGFGSDQLALLLDHAVEEDRCLKVTEVALNDHYPVADVMMNGMGFGHPLDFEPMLKTPGFIEMAWKAPIYLIAAGLGVEVAEVRGSLDRRITDRDIEVAFGTIPAGTCGAVCTRAAVS